jgi:SAM-dependent methyltransferase
MASMSVLNISESEIRRHGPGNLLGVCWRQWRIERTLARRGINFRSADPSDVAAAYAQMTPEEFDTVNGRQNWANWRTIPRALSGRVLNRPLIVLDLGSGTGGSTCVLAFYCPAGSRILGYEMADSLIQIARRRQYLHRSGKPAAVQFHCQGITQTLRQVNGRPWPKQSVDLVNASGIIGQHLSKETLEPLCFELQRVVSLNGLAMLDVGPTVDDEVLTCLMNAAGFRRLGRCRSWRMDPTGQVLFQNCNEASRSFVRFP